MSFFYIRSDYSKGFGGKFGVESDKKDEVRYQLNDKGVVKCSLMNSPQAQEYRRPSWLFVGHNNDINNLIFNYIINTINFCLSQYLSPSSPSKFVPR